MTVLTTDFVEVELGIVVSETVTGIAVILFTGLVEIAEIVPPVYESAIGVIVVEP
jgi:hypothetical protein